MTTRSVFYKKIGLISLLYLVLSSQYVFSEENEGISGDIFGKESGYFHPGLTVSETYNDNIYNTKEKEEDFITTITPSLLLSLPGTKEEIKITEASSGMPGGLTKTRFRSDTLERYKTYIFYGSQFESYSDNDDANTDSHILEGAFQFNLKGGLSFDVVDQYFRSHDVRGNQKSVQVLPDGSESVTVSNPLDKFENNLLDAMINYDITSKLQARMGASMYNVHYSSSRNDYRDRQDNGLSGYVFFHLLPKTSVYTGYERINVDYDKNIENGLSDSSLNRYFAGIKWDITAKSKGNFKAGYMTRDFDRKTLVDGSRLDDTDGFLSELTIDHDFTSNTSVSVTGARKNTESDVIGSNYIESTSLGLSYNQKITTKITAIMKLGWENADYQNILVTGANGTRTATYKRTDDIYTISPSLEYMFTDWLRSELAYTYKTRYSDSDDPNIDYDFENNTFMLTLTAAI